MDIHELVGRFDKCLCHVAACLVELVGQFDEFVCHVAARVVELIGLFDRCSAVCVLLDWLSWWAVPKDVSTIWERD